MKFVTASEQGHFISFQIQAKKDKTHLPLKDPVNILTDVLLHLTTPRSTDNVEGTNSASWAPVESHQLPEQADHMAKHNGRRQKHVTRSGERKYFQQQQHKPKPG